MTSTGLGQRIHIAISLFLDSQLLTLIMAIDLMVTLVDALSGWLRRRVIEKTSPPGASGSPPWPRARGRRTARGAAGR